MILNEEDKNVRDIFNIFVAYIITIDNSTLSEGYLTSVLDFYEQRDFNKSTHKAFLQMFSGMNLNIFDYEIREENNHKKIYTTHKIDDINYSLKISQESEGTKKVVSLIPLMHACLELGGVLVVDELDSKLHPKLLAYIMDLFRDKTTNKRNAQLVFTSHDLMTMDSKYLRRDEIWFIGKNSKEESQLYSLIEFKKENGLQPRKDESYNKQYFEGRYGSDPYLKKIIEWK